MELYKNPSLVSKDEIILDIYDENGNVLKSVEFSAFNVGDPSRLRIDFDVIKDSSDKNFGYSLRIKKLADGKLEVGLVDKEIVIWHFYKAPVSIRRSMTIAGDYVVEIFKNQKIVLLMPMVSLLLLL